MSGNSNMPMAIIDTSVLLTFYELGFIDKLQLFFAEVRVPREVESEFLNSEALDSNKDERFKWLSEVYEKHKTWIKACNEYGTDLVDLYLTEPKIDKGEAEAFAQHQALGSVHTVLIDEKEGRKLALRKKIQHNGVLSLIARLDLQLQICDYRTTVASLMEKGIGRYTQEIVDRVYQSIKEELGVN